MPVLLIQNKETYFHFYPVFHQPQTEVKLRVCYTIYYGAMAFSWERMVELATENKDLVWELGGFNQRQRAVDFVMGFENKICVYSDSVEQLYTNYNIFFPREENRRLVILPNPYAHHDIFNGIPQSAVAPTGLSIIPGDIVQKQGLYLLVPSKQAKSRFRAVPLQTGLRVINQRRPAARPLLPVLMKGDLRELQSKTPSLHLHCLQLHQLEYMSRLEQQSIQKTILGNLKGMQ